MRAMVHKAAEAEEYYFKEGCHILELWNADADAQVSIARARVAPGERTRRHRLLETSERYLILSGEGWVTVGDLEPQQVSAGSVVVIPPGVDQSIRNSGTTELVFLAICSPRFRPEAYRESE